MPEHFIDFLLEVDLESVRKWELLIKGICNGQLGAYFEERIEEFGEAATKMASTILDEWYEFNTPPSFENYKRRKTNITFTMIDGSGIEHRAKSMIQLFETCGAVTSITTNFLEDR